MRKNALKQKWANNETGLNGWLHIPAGWSTEVMAHAGYDSLCIDMQHGQLDFVHVLEMLRAISTTDTVPLVRVPWNEPGMIGRVLDAGAYGIICPMVNTKEECEQFVKACRYHPEGFRSRGPTRANVYAGADYVHHANEEILTIAMVETAEALSNLEAIASVPGVDMIYIGPGDLSLSLLGMARSGADLEDDEIFAALDKVIAACNAAGIIPGMHTLSGGYAKKMIERGFKFVTVMSDTLCMKTMAEQTIADIRGTTVTASKSAY